MTQGILSTVKDMGIVLGAVSFGCLLPGLLLIRPSRRTLFSPFLWVVSYACGYAGFTVTADLLTRWSGTNFFTLLIGPPVVVCIIGLACNRGRAAQQRAIPPELDLSWGQFAACLTFGCLVLLQVAPISVGDHVYWGRPYTDWTKHVGVTYAVARTGSPPLNPMYAPFGESYLFYYYGFYLLPGALVRYAGSAAVPTLLCFSMLTAACFAAVSVSLGNYLAGTLRGGWVALALCFVTGLDLLALVWPLDEGIRLFDMEWWNPGQVTAITGFLAWAPQHSSAAVYVLVSHILLGGMDVGPSTRRLGRLIPVMLLASACAMTSTYVAEVLFLSLGLHGLWAITRRGSRLIAFYRTMVILAISSLLILPFYWHLLAIDRYVGPSQLPIFRPFAGESVATRLPFFQWFDRCLPYFGSSQAYRLFTLPFQYALEFGFWAIVAVTFFFTRRFDGERGAVMSRLRVMGICALLLGSVFVSVRSLADLNWRVLHPLQGALVGMGAAFLVGWREQAKHQGLLLKFAVASTLSLGVAGTVFDFADLRFSILDPLDLSPEVVGRAKKGGPQVEAITAATDRIQFNPTAHPPWQVYLNRPFILSDRQFNSRVFGVSLSEHRVVSQEVSSIFLSGITPEEREMLIARYQIDYLLIQQEDPIFDKPLGNLFLRPPPIVWSEDAWILLRTSVLIAPSSPTRPEME